MKIVVIGGVAGGMSFAARARRLDESAEITVLERGKYVSFANCGLPYFVSGEITDPDDLLLQTPEKLAASLNLNVLVEHEALALNPETKELTVKTPEGVSQISYDNLVLAPGAYAFVPPIPGIGSDRVQTLRTVDDAKRLREHTKRDGLSAVVLGAGFIGVEAAEALAATGVEVHLVELAEHVLPPIDEEAASLVQNELDKLGIRSYTGVGATELIEQNDRVRVVLADGTAITADIVVASLGVRPDTQIFADAGIETDRGAIVVDETGRTNIENIWAVGDATVSTDPITGAKRPVALAGPANRAGRLVADNMLRPELAKSIPQPLGTAIVRVGELTVGLTGASRKALSQAELEFIALQLHPNQHAGYFPGAQQLHLSIYIAPETGKILGAQAVGAEGVDKRIDVLATAMRAGLSITDLIDLDLAYSPPYGQAKDPINLAGMVGENVLNGTLKTWDARQLEQIRRQALLLDVRGYQEAASGIVPDAVLIPHTELRQRLDEVRELAQGRPVRVMCASGVRSAIAHRILTQEGFDSASLMGGMLSLKAYLGPQSTAALLVSPESPDQR